MGISCCLKGAADRWRLMTLRSIARTAVYQSEKLLQAARFAHLPEPPGGWPALLGISFPKSGTHLLDQVLLGFSRIAPYSRRLHSFYAEYEGESGSRRPPGQALAWLDSLGPRDVASAHLFAAPETVARVASRAFVPFFIFRDPRDVVVSHVFYVSEMEDRHVHHDYYASLPDMDSRLRTSILGRPDLEIEFPHIAARFSPYLGWLNHPEVLAIHFEDLIHDRTAALGRLAGHFLRRVPLKITSGTIVGILESSIDPDRSPTFRSRRTGEWKQHFSAEHKRLFKSVADDLLIRLGYETDDNW
jgi:hypothetical protein